MRGDGGYIVVAPSTHPSGNEYAWELSSRPGEVELPEWPEWLLDALQASNGRPAGPAPAVEGTIPEGQRNATLTSLGGSMRRRGFTPEAILAALRIENQRCIPPLPDAEVGQISASVARYEPTLLPVTLTVTKDRQGRYCRHTLADLRADYKPTEWLVESLFPYIGSLLIAGIPGIGKTWLVLLFALAVASGRQLLGRFQTRQGAVLLVLEEEDRAAVLERLDLIYAGLGLSQEEGDALPIHVLIQQGVSLVTEEGVLSPELLRHIDEVQPVLIVFDPLRRVHGLDENDSGQMSLVFNLLRQLQAEKNCSLLLIHHLRKRSDGPEDILDRVRGSSGITASVDSVLEVGGQFGHQVIRHSKSKRGPTLGSFHIQGELSAEKASFRFLDPDVAAEIERSEVRKFVLQVLREEPLNQSRLWDAGKKRGYGRDRIKKMCAELEKEGLLEQRDGPRGSKLFALTDLVVDAPAPPSTTRSREEDRERF